MGNYKDARTCPHCGIYSTRDRSSILKHQASCERKQLALAARTNGANEVPTTLRRSETDHHANLTAQPASNAFPSMAAPVAERRVLPEVETIVTPTRISHQELSRENSPDSDIVIPLETSSRLVVDKRHLPNMEQFHGSALPYPSKNSPSSPLPSPIPKSVLNPMTSLKRAKISKTRSTPRFSPLTRPHSGNYSRVSQDSMGFENDVVADRRSSIENNSREDARERALQTLNLICRGPPRIGDGAFDHWSTKSQSNPEKEPMTANNISQETPAVVKRLISIIEQQEAEISSLKQQLASRRH